MVLAALEFSKMLAPHKTRFWEDGCMVSIVPERSSLALQCARVMSGL